MRGLGQFQQKIREEKKEKILSFIEKSQPITYTDIMTNGGFRRNTLRSYINDLKKTRRVFEINDYLVCSPFSPDVQKFVEQQRELNGIEFCLKNLKKISAKLDKLRTTQPLRYALAFLKATPARHKHKFFKTDGSYTCDCGLLRIDGKYYVPENDFLKTLGKLNTVLPFFHALLKHFWICPRFEGSGTQRIFKGQNPSYTTNIKPKFRTSDGKPDYTKIEKEYRKNEIKSIIELNIKHLKKTTQLDMTDIITHRAALIDLFNDGVISHEKFREECMKPVKPLNKLKFTGY